MRDSLIDDLHELFVDNDMAILSWVSKGPANNPDMKSISNRLNTLGYMFEVTNGEYIYDGDIVDILLYMIEDGIIESFHKYRLTQGAAGSWNSSVGLIRAAGYDVEVVKVAHYY